jgi:hypothetical protein
VSQTGQKKQPGLSPKVPLWYWLTLAGVALVGIILILYSAALPVNVVGITTEGDYFQGNPDAPVTIIDWGNFG